MEEKYLQASMPPGVRSVDELQALALQGLRLGSVGSMSSSGELRVSIDGKTEAEIENVRRALQRAGCSNIH